MKKVKKTKKKIEEMFSGTQVGVLIEDFKDDVRVVAENQIGLQDELQSFKKDMYSFKKDMYSFRDEMYSFRDEMYEFRDLVLEDLDEIKMRLDRIEKDIEEVKENKADKKWAEQRINYLERELTALKMVILKK